jgi:hypothetical protein
MSATTTPQAPEIDDALRAAVRRLSRPHPSGGDVIERAAILAEGTDSAAIVEWVTVHGGQPQTAAPEGGRGLHGAQLNERAGTQRRPPLRYVLPAGALA